MKLFLSQTIAALLIFIFSLQAQIVIENPSFKLTLQPDGTVSGLTYKADEQELLIQGKHIPAFSAFQFRPYDNETQLTYLSGPTMFYSNSIKRLGDTLYVGFDKLDYTAEISLDIKDDYIVFTPEYFTQRKKKMGVVAETRIDKVTFLQLPVKNKKHYGQWLNVMWDDDVAVGLLATDVYTQIDATPYDEGFHLMKAAGIKDIKLTKAGAALIVASKDNFLKCVSSLENDYNLPPGAGDRQNKDIEMSYYECRNLTRDNIDQHIRYALQGGFRMMVIYYPSFASSMGHFTWRKEYPNGMADLKNIVNKIKSSGFIPGFHIHYNKAQINDPYVQPVPDPRLNLRKHFTLTNDLLESDTTIVIEENPDGITLFEGRRLLKAGDEIIEYSGIKTDYPYAFLGCKRGMLNSSADSYKRGQDIGLLDVDNWPIFIRFNQKTSIQDEVADRIAKFVKECGFRFIYFDGAEDVNRPFWYNIGLAQKRVYDKLEPKPVFSEGASKTHYNWHILSRGNAFDHFKPEHIKEAVDSICIPAAQFNAESFTNIDFGWIAYTPPSKHTIGIQPDMIEYILSHSVGFHSGLSLVGIIDSLKAHPLTSDNLRTFRIWEDAKSAGFFTEEQRQMMKQKGTEFTLLVNKKGDYELYPCRQIKPIDKNNKLRAFLFERNGKVWVSYWMSDCNGSVELNIAPNMIKVFDTDWNKVNVKKLKGNKVVLPADKKRFIQFNLPEEDVTGIIKSSVSEMY